MQLVATHVHHLAGWRVILFVFGGSDGLVKATAHGQNAADNDKPQKYAFTLLPKSLSLHF
jgi:hypothetical protein